MSELDPHNSTDPEAPPEPVLGIEGDDAAMAGQLPLDLLDAAGIELEEGGELTDIKAAKGGSAAKTATKVAKSKREVKRVRKRQMSMLQERRKQKRIKVFYGRIRAVFKVCFVALWCVLLYQILHSPYWKMDAPRYELSNSQLMQAAQLKPFIVHSVDKPLYAVDTGKLAARIEKHFDIIESVHVRRELFPARLNVVVVEKQPWARVYSSEKSVRPYAVLANQEVVALAPYGYKVGPDAQHTYKVLVSPQTTFSKEFLPQVESIAYQLQQLPGLTFQHLDLRNPEVVVAQFAEIRLILGRLDNTAADRLSRVVPLIPKIREFRSVMESVDLRWEQQITFHKKAKAVIKLSTGDEEEGH